MSSVAVDPSVEELKLLVDAAIGRLENDAVRLQRALRAVPPGASATRSVFDVLRASRRQLLTTFGSVLALDAPDPAKRHALTWLSLGAAGLGTFYRALQAAGRSAPAVARRERRLARNYFAHAEDAFRELDRALGCPYDCEVGG